jgi:hypothetical protein
MTELRILEFMNDLDKIAVAIGTLRQNGELGNGQELTREQQDDLLICQIKLLRTSASYSAQAISLNVDSIKEPLERLSRAAATMEDTLARIATVQEVIDFSAVAIGVAAAVASGDILSVATTLNKLLDSISKING